VAATEVVNSLIAKSHTGRQF